MDTRMWFFIKTWWLKHWIKSKNMEHLQCGKPLLVKSKCKMILASISIQVLIILASSHVWTRYDNLLLASWCNKINSPKLIECDSFMCSNKIVPKHKFLFKLSLIFRFGFHDSIYGNTKHFRDCWFKLILLFIITTNGSDTSFTT